MPLNGAMKLPTDDDDLQDDRFDDDDEQAFFKNKDSYDTNPPRLNPILDVCLTSIASIQFLWLYRRLECVLSIILLISVTLAVTGVIESYEMKKHSFKNHHFVHEYADVKSALELKLGDIDHWCLDGTDNTCFQCDDPTRPTSRGEYEGWRMAFMRNVKLSKEFEMKGVQPDIIFIGDSLVEATVGTLKGLEGMDNSPAAKELDNIKGYYDKKFTKANGGKYDALRLGIAGDTSPNVFWRIKEKEMRSLTPQVWWISVGRNDMFRTSCSEEVALMGVIRIVEELISRNDGATIVINSLLPTATKSSLQLEGNFAHNDMWKSIQEVNNRLKKFASRHHHVLFYDATDVFTETRLSRKYITKKLYADFVHPSFEGYKALVQNQLEYLDSLMLKRVNSQTKTLPSQTTGSSTQTETSEDTHEGDLGQEFTNYDDYYSYEGIYEEYDDIFSDVNLYNDDFSIFDDNFDDW